MKRSALAALCLAVPTFAVSQEFPVHDSACDISRGPTLRVPSSMSSVSQAIEEIDEEGRVLVAAGRYQENIRIPPQKRVVIQAQEGDERPVFYPLRSDFPVIFVAPAAELCLIGISIRSDGPGVVAGQSSHGDQPRRARAVALQDVGVTGASHGIYALAEQVTIRGSRVTNNRWGLVVGGAAAIEQTVISGNTSLGALVSANPNGSCQGTNVQRGIAVLVKESKVIGNQGVGLVICNTGLAAVLNNTISQNRYVGVQVYNTGLAKLGDNEISGTKDKNGSWGDGLHIIDSRADLESNRFLKNRRAGIIYYGASSGSVTSNELAHAIFSIAISQHNGKTPSPTIGKNWIHDNKENRVTYASGTPLPSSKTPDVPPPP